MSLMHHMTWNMPVDVHFGAGSSQRIAADLGERRCVVVAFDQAFELGLQSHWKQQLGSKLLAWLPAPQGPSTLLNAERLAHHVEPLLRTQPEMVLLGLGGGSVMDLAKVLRALLQGRRFDDGAPCHPAPTPPSAAQPMQLWLMPTTAGTGREVTRWATLHALRDGQRVTSVFDQGCDWANRAYIDPWLSATCPPSLARAAALTTLRLALVSIMNPRAHALGQGLGLWAARTVVRNLPSALEDPFDLQLRSELSLAALRAGMACSQMQAAEVDPLMEGLVQPASHSKPVQGGAGSALKAPGSNLDAETWLGLLTENMHADLMLSSVFQGTPGEGARSLSNWLLEVDCPQRRELHTQAARPPRVPAMRVAMAG